MQVTEAGWCKHCGKPIQRRYGTDDEWVHAGTYERFCRIVRLAEPGSGRGSEF